MAFETTAAAVFTNLFAAGLARFGSLAFHKVVRIKKIEQEIKAGPTQTKPIARALHDLQTVIGTCYGPYTQELDSFFAELQRSGIIGLIAEEAAFARKNPVSKGVFVRLHRERFPSAEFDSERLFKVVYRCFKISLSEQTNDKALAFLIDALDKSLNRRLESISNSVASQSFGALRLSPSNYIDNARKISRGLQSTYKSIRVETNKGARMVDITRIYIPSKLRFSKNYDLFRTSGLVIRADIMNRRHFQDPMLIEYKDFCRGFQRVVVLGDPGGGKSTLCQYLCYELSRMLLLDSARTREPGRDYQLQKIPIRVVLRTFEKARKTEPQLDVFSFICREVRNATTLGAHSIEQTLQRALEVGHVALAFDGLDEILDTSLRRDFVELVVGFCDQFPLCPVCVTSRLVGYEEARLPDVFEEIYLERFDDREVKQYVEKFLRVVASHTAKESQDRAAEFLAQTETNAHDLRQNPLLLGLMAWLFYMKGDVPTNRPEIYSECAILMFERWDQRRGIEARIPSDFDMLHLFSQLAAKIYGNSELEGGVDSGWLKREIRGYFEGQYENRAKAHSASKALVDFITGRAWVMSEVGQDVFRFTHRTFLEYFFARHLDELYDSVNELLGILKRRILKGEWDVVVISPCN